jgi:hypothetical protein
MTDSEQVEQVKYLLKFIKAASSVLSARMSMLLALLLTFVLFLWALSTADTTRLVAATIFACLVYLPTVWLDVHERNRAATSSKGD